MKGVFKVAYVLVHVVLVVVALSLATVLAALLFVRTDEGKAKLLAFGLPRLQTVLGGRLKVGRIEGDLLHTIIVYDAELAAADGRPAIRARRLEGHFALVRLLFGEKRIEDLHGEGMWFGMHFMPDGRFNLAGLTAPPKPDAPPPDPRKRIHFVIAHAHLEGELRYDAPSMPVSIQVVEARVLVEGGFEIDGSTIRVPLDHIDGALLPPLAAPVSAHGQLVIADGGLTLEGVGVSLGLDEAALHRLLPDELMGRLAPLIDQLGPSQIELRTEGIVNPIAIQVRAAFPRTGATLDGVVTLAGDGPGWSVTAEASGARFASKGRLDWNWIGPVEGSVDASEFSRLAVFGLPDIGGHVRAAAKLALRGRGNELAVDVDGSDVRYSSLRMNRIEMRAATAGDAGVVNATAHGVHAGPVFLDKLVLGARDDGKALEVTVDAHARQGRLELAVRGTPVLGAGRRMGAAFEHALVDGTLHAEGQTWQTTQSAQVHVGDTIRVDGLALASGSARVTGSGFYDTAGGANGKLGARLQGDHIDLQQLVALVAPGVVVPKGELQVDLRAGGTVHAPIVDATMSAKTVETAEAIATPPATPAPLPITAPLPTTAPPPTVATHATLTTPTTAAIPPTVPTPKNPRDRTIVPSSTATAATIPRPSPATSSTATAAIIPPPATAAIIPPPATAPVVADWKHAFPATTATVSAHYGGGRVRGDLSARMAGQSLTASFALPASRTGGGPIAGRALFDIDVARLPALAQALHLPVQSGHFSGTGSLGGTWRVPLFSVQAKGLGLAGKHFDRVDLTLSASADPSAAKAEAVLTLRGMPLVTLRGQAALAGIAPFGTSLLDHWRVIPVGIAGEVRGYPLALIPELAEHIGGEVNGTLALTGTFGHPVGSASLQVAGLRLGDVPFGRFGADAHFDGTEATVKIDAAARTGTFVVTAKLPVEATSPWHIEAQLAEFPLDLAALPFAGIRSVKGTMNAELKIDGTRARPLMSGFARARDGALALGNSSFVYDHGAIDLAMEGEGEGQRLTLRKLSFSAATGSFEATGQARLDGLNPVAADGRATLKKYPVALKGVNGWLTANIDLHVKKDSAGLSGTVVVWNGLARLADLSRVRSNQSTSMPGGVRYVDAAGLREVEAARSASQEAQVKIAKVVARAEADPNAKPDNTLTVTIPGPFHVEGKEVHATLKGELHIDRIQSQPRISGVIESTGGTVDLLGRRYELEMLNVDFDGGPIPDPQLDVRITRSTDVTVVIEVQGASSNPDVIFSSIPPVYSEEQVMAMIVSGSPSSTDAGSESIDDRVAGALSGTFVGQLKDQLLPILPVDVIKVDLAKNSLGQEDTRLEVGKYITESVYVSYVHQLGTIFGVRRLNRNQLQLEYRFARHFEVETSFGDNGVGALDLYWNHRF